MLGNVEFHEDQEQRRALTFALYQTKPPVGITGWMLRQKVAKNVAQANLILLVCAVLFFLLSLFFFFSSGKSTGEVTYLEDIPFETRNALPPEILKNLPSKYRQ